MRVALGAGSDEPLASLLVELPDSLPHPGDRLDQPPALTGEVGRQPGQAFDLGGQRLMPFGEGGALARHGLDAVLPRTVLERDGGEALASARRFAQQAIVLALSRELGGAPL